MVLSVDHVQPAEVYLYAKFLCSFDACHMPAGLESEAYRSRIPAAGFQIQRAGDDCFNQRRDLIQCNVTQVTFQGPAARISYAPRVLLYSAPFVFR